MAVKREEAAVYVHPSKLTPWERNPRKNDPAVADVAASIKRFGFGAPIVARKEDGQIIAGHTRWQAAMKLGLEKVPVRYLDLSAEEAHALAIADNKLGELAMWDDAELAVVLKDLQSEHVDLSGIGWSDDELSKLLEDPSLDPAAAFGRLPNGAPEVVTMNFTLTRAQREVVQSAIVAARAAGAFDTDGNGNGLALERICNAYLDRQGS